MPLKHRKIAIMGHTSVGKSSLSVQFVEGQFVDCYIPTIEHTFRKTITLGAQTYELKLVDTAGQDEYTIFPTHYTLDAHGYILVYSINSKKSFEILKLIYQKLLNLSGKPPPVILVGNKLDLDIQRMVSFEEGKKLADEWNAVFIETSAKRNTAVDEIFRSLLFMMEKRERILDGKVTHCLLS